MVHRRTVEQSMDRWRARLSAQFGHAMPQIGGREDVKGDQGHLRSDHRGIRRRTAVHNGFTLIELLTVIAIIAVLAAILFPLAGTVREQARASDCMTKMHQLYVAARVYKEDEGAFPPALFGYVETLSTDPGCTADPGVPRAIPYSGAGSFVAADKLINGFLFREQVKSVSAFRCPDTPALGPDAITVARYPNTQPGDPNQAYYWPASWIGDVLRAKGCPSDDYGTIDCFWDISPADPCVGHLYLQPKYFYVADSYDIGPRIGPDGKAVLGTSSEIIYDRHYSTDWTGVKGLNDLPNQLKYANPPADTTLLTYCTWHQASNNTGTVIAISLAGTARKIDVGRMLRNGPNVFNQ